MNKKKIIPDIPEYEKVTEEVEKRLLAYIEYVKGLSSRIKIIRPSIDKKFNLDDLEEAVKKFLFGGPNIRINDWPKKTDVAFIVAVDSSVDSEKKNYWLKNVRVFCYGDFSFGCGYNDFVAEDEEEEENIWPFSFSEPSGDLSTWENSIRIIKYHLDEIQKKVPSLPPDEQPA